MELPSKTLENAVNLFSSLPGIGKKTALRLVLHLLKRETSSIEDFSNGIGKLGTDIVYCKQCHNLSDFELCRICADPGRKVGTLCVVADLRDVMAIESTYQYKGLYHILGGLISPIDGIGPDALNIDDLIDRLDSGKVEEVIFALAATMEGDTTTFYISRRIKDSHIKLTTIARGISVGGEIEYADEVTLGRSILTRVPYKS